MPGAPFCNHAPTGNANMSQLQGLIFDFDGLILETELPIFQSWRQLFTEYGAELELGTWVRCVGSSYDAFNPALHLEEQIGTAVDREALHRRAQIDSNVIIDNQQPLPGVQSLLEDARQHHLKLAVASSSDAAWVHRHLQRLNLEKYFLAVCTSDDVAEVKPNPALYQLALQQLDLQPAEAIAFEDSPNGIRAARLAGLRCIAVPNPVTQSLDFSHANAIITSLAEINLQTLFLLE